MSRDWQALLARVLCFGLATMGPVVGSVAEELTDSNVMERFTCRRGPAGIDLRRVWSALSTCFNVDARASPVHGGRIYVPAT